MMVIMMIVVIMIMIVAVSFVAYLSAMLAICYRTA